MSVRRLVPVLLIAALLLALVPTTAAQETVTIRARCRAGATEEWRCNNFAEVEAEVEAALGIDIQLELIQDNLDWGRTSRSSAFV